MRPAHGVLLLLLVAGCDRHRREFGVAPDASPPSSNPIAIADADAESSDATDAEVGVDSSVTPAAPRAPLKHFVAHALTMSAHGIDGTIELWRDARIDDAFVKKNWFGLTFEYGLPEPFKTVPPANALVVVKSADGRFVSRVSCRGRSR